jgi:3-hydroxyisobutyrate dehydrogenase-like beta-hydroxyacid dehydrogenase
MSVNKIGLLNPGQMGVTIGAAAAAGAQVLWASAGRGAATRQRAAQASFTDMQTLAALVSASDVIISVCPPHAALELAGNVATLGFRKVFVDANAVSPVTARAIQQVVTSAGARFVDGGIIGPPAVKAGTTRLYLSGDDAATVAELFSGSNVEAIAIGTQPGAASALKMCYAAYTKGSTALILAVRALAEAEQISDALVTEWKRSQPGLTERSENAARNNARKAWRFAGEMREIADTFAAAGLPDGFYRAAAELYETLAGFKDAPQTPELDQVVAALLGKGTE